MQSIIGLGNAGCNLADQFSQYSQYKIYKIDVGIKGKNCLNVLPHDGPEEYEKNCSILKMRPFLKKIEGDILFISSCGDISGLCLRALEILKKKKKNKISILYIKPDLGLLNEKKSLQENLMFGVMQEYARSGVFERINLVSNATVSEIIGDVPIKEYYNRINEVVVSTYHMINVFENSDSIIDTFSNSPPSVRIQTFGIVDFESGKEKMFFSLDKVRDKRYYYAIPDDVVDNDGGLLNKIKKQVKSRAEHDKMKITYGIYSTQYDVSYSYCVAKCSYVQQNSRTEDLPS